MNLVLAFIAFNFIIIIHELGHFIAAKKFGIKVLEFSLFIGPKIFSIKRGETEYSLRLFPIMAYVKMEGEEEESDSSRAFRNKPWYARAVVAAAAPFANILTALVILTGVFSVMGFNTNRVDQVFPGSAAEKAGIRPGDVIVRYDNKRALNPTEIVQFLYIGKGQPANVVLKRGNEEISTIIKPDIIPEQERYLLGITVPSPTGPDSNVIRDLYPGRAAEKAGLKPGDRIVKLNDTDIASKQDIDNFMKANGGNPLKVTVLRDGSTYTYELTPSMEKIPQQYDLGINFSFEQGSITKAFSYSLVYVLSIIKSVGYSIVWLITGKAPLSQMMGPVGIVSTISSVVEQGPNLSAQLLYLLQMTALFSTAVGAFQLIPFPMMDGNKLLLILVEAVRRKPIPAEKEVLISMVGFVILILFAIYAFYNDVMRLIGGG